MVDRSGAAGAAGEWRRLAADAEARLQRDPAKMRLFADELEVEALGRGTFVRLNVAFLARAIRNRAAALTPQTPT